MPVYFHGGKSGLGVGDAVVPAPPHVQDGCPICEAKRDGRVCTVGEYRRWLSQFGVRAEPILRKLRDAPDWEAVDPPREAVDGVYLTTSREYATWYAARSAGDLYQVKADGEARPSSTDHFDTVIAASARVVAVVRRGVRLTRTERRTIERLWKKADARADKRRESAKHDAEDDCR
jgi:hypothetical protein